MHLLIALLLLLTACDNKLYYGGGEEITVEMSIPDNLTSLEISLFGSTVELYRSSSSKIIIDGDEKTVNSLEIWTDSNNLKISPPRGRDIRPKGDLNLQIYLKHSLQIIDVEKATIISKNPLDVLREIKLKEAEAYLSLHLDTIDVRSLDNSFFYGTGSIKQLNLIQKSGVSDFEDVSINYARVELMESATLKYGSVEKHLDKKISNCSKIINYH